MYNYSYVRMKGMIIMKQIPDGLRKEMTVLKTEEIMPNFAELSKKYHLDYRTIKSIMKDIKENQLIIKNIQS